MLKKCLIFGLINLCLFMFGGFGLPCFGQGGSIIYTNLAHYLTNRPWVKEITFEKSYTTHQGFSTFRASLQPNGFFYQCLSNSPYGRVYIYCESADAYWQITSNECDVSWKAEADGGSPSNRLQSICPDMRQLLNDVLNLGIEGLDNRNVIWTSPTTFTSDLLDWLGKPTPGNIEVRIESDYQNLPSRLQCISTTGKGRQQYDITCQYDQPILPPREIIIKQMVNGTNLFFTNIVEKVTFGLRDDATQGFVPSNFVPESLTSKSVIVESNGLAYVDRKGVRQLLIDQSAVERQEALTAAAKKIQASLVMGTKFSDFSVQNLDGKPLSLADCKGKVVLIDFWATWCAPCQAEVPNVVATYKKYHSQGFDIIGVSLDQDREKLLSFIKDKDMTWPQYFDRQGWGNKLAMKYGILKIPTTYLLNTNGVIVATDLLGPALEQAVSKALSKN